MAISSCPSCGKQKWAMRTDPADFRQKVLHCMECGFEVDLRVVRASRHIVRQDGGQDLRAAEPASEPAQGAGE
jgi:transcription elongation factor Elf1